jgi:hypothetical protein
MSVHLTNKSVDDVERDSHCFCGRRSKYKYNLIEIWRIVNQRVHVVTLSFAELSCHLLPSLGVVRLA